MHEIGHVCSCGRSMALNTGKPPIKPCEKRLASKFVRDSSLWKSLPPEEQWIELLNLLSRAE